MNSINFGLRLGGGISDPFFLQANPNETENFWGRFFTDISFFIIIKLVALSIISGIIIDAFGQLREELVNRREDQNQICSICGFDKWYIEKGKTQFEDHVLHQHNIWNYLYFMIRINKENNNAFNGIEHYVFLKYMNDETDWIP